LKNYYQLLELTPAASAEDIKKAFRRQIAKYHPDKVQHLGKEFQAMAEERAAELTESYRVLTDAGLREEYDQTRAAAGSSSDAATTAPTPAKPTPSASAPPPPPPAPDAEPSIGAKVDSRFVEERATRDQFVRQAAIGQFRRAFAQLAGGTYDEWHVRGFDIACEPKAKRFARAEGPRLLGRFVPCVDGAAVADAWTRARILDVPPGEEMCVFLMGITLVPQRELAAAIAEQRRRPQASGKLTLIPVDASVWQAHVPTDAPAVAKDLLARLLSGG
jgi:hypothetical protein